MNQKYYIWICCFLLLISGVFSYTAPPFNSINMTFSGAVYVAPANNDINITFGEVIVQENGSTLVDVCGTITIFHNQNLSCQFNATSDFTNLTNPLVWAVNDSRVNLTASNNTAYVVDDPVLQEYNLPGCWDINVSISDLEGPGSDSHIFKYCINDTSPLFNETIGNQTITNLQDFLFVGNVTDNEADPYFTSINCTIVQTAAINTTSQYNITKIANGTVEQQICEITISDTVLNSTQSFLFNISTDADFIALYNVTLGANLSEFRPSINFTNVTTQINGILNLINISVLGTENVTNQNPYFVLNNTDTQDLNASCKSDNNPSDLLISVNDQLLSSNRTNISSSNFTLFYQGIPPGGTVSVFPFWEYIDFNFTVERNITVNLSCIMEV